MTRLGYQIPNFTYPGVGPDRLFDVVAQQAREADRSGFDTVLVMDHFYQLPMLGNPDDFMLECYSLLSALARETSNVKLSSLVTGNTYRNPAVLAKTVTTLDIVSNGRAQLGIGAGWFELEHDAFGIEFGTFTDRFEKLEEALQIIISMLRGERASLDGSWYTARDAMNEPPPVSRIPVMIGGGGERKTLRMVAQYADESNIICPDDQIDRKLEALAAHCEALGRDRSEITVSKQKSACIAPTREQAEEELLAYFDRRGLALRDASDEERAPWFANFAWGDPDTVGETYASLLRPGLDGFTINMPANGHLEGRVELLGQTLTPIIG
ncbi:MAG: LLM class F420-dependent oxidoreductase [Ilumatobacter sp.]|uniref:LLM class F420-dependent oxidoreductase n=1 Tax=Ilumatobacter sp. TaxID=1967498 RepID=UPI00391C3812